MTVTAPILNQLVHLLREDAIVPYLGPGALADVVNVDSVITSYSIHYTKLYEM